MADLSPPRAAPLEPLATQPTELILTILKSIERPHDDLPAMAIHAACEARGGVGHAGRDDGATVGHHDHGIGLQLDVTLPQLELLWRVWKENVARPGRTAAGALGVWGMLLRNAKVKHIAVDIAPLVVTLRLPARLAGGVGAPLAVLRAERFRSSLAVTQETEDVHVQLPGLALDLHEPSSTVADADADDADGVGADGAGLSLPSAPLPQSASAARGTAPIGGTTGCGRASTTALPLIVSPWDLHFYAHEDFPGGTTHPSYVSRWVESSQPLVVGLCERRLRLLCELLHRFVNGPSDRPEGSAGRFPEPEPDLRLRCALSELRVQLYHRHAGEKSGPPLGSAAAECAEACRAGEFLWLQLHGLEGTLHARQLVAPSPPPPLPSPLLPLNPLHRPERLETVASFQSAVPLAADVVSAAGGHQVDYSLCLGGLRAYHLPSNADRIEFATLEVCSAQRPGLPQTPASALGAVHPAASSVARDRTPSAFWLEARMQSGESHRTLEGLDARAGTLRLRLEPTSVSSLVSTFGPIRRRLRTLETLLGPAAARFLDAHEKRDVPFQVRARQVRVSGMLLVVELSLRRSSWFLRSLASALIGDRLRDSDAANGTADDADSGPTNNQGGPDGIMGLTGSVALRVPPLSFARQGTVPSHGQSDDTLISGRSFDRLVAWHYVRHPACQLLGTVGGAMLRSWQLRVLLLAVAAAVVAALVAVCMRDTPAPPAELGGVVLAGDTWMVWLSGSVEAMVAVPPPPAHRSWVVRQGATSGLATRIASWWHG